VCTEELEQTTLNCTNAFHVIHLDQHQSHPKGTSFNASNLEEAQYTFVKGVQYFEGSNAVGGVKLMPDYLSRWRHFSPNGSFLGFEDHFLSP
jgi:hypothetical protein